ncbi:hypothetical protein [Campylobacter hyointestinalis]|uniref:hypothetical protein n=1 Tax=Campylobacter hyointestinalis TaxID=198 RepID=UPI000726CF7C|nr:hypothetical protein [Campylobacter hyointestinalis]PPB63085.1 hypothetical protein CDQ72_01420 [Campylobacter hyointestinalis subsp. hyointestinalis]PPB65355.1 hypothetical protein CDQ73_01170 [Campylobacter hyointestinalis subsp. hyointestinalis]CUU72362.1 Uncharacterised protein [Campylobacter hyointestinalis subsp. hyointestinalis]
MIIQIDKFFFMVKDNIESITKTLNINLDKQNTITKPIYTYLGGYEEAISFEANILLSEQNRFKDFENLVKEVRPLKISCFDLVSSEHIVINSLTQIAKNFIKTEFNGVTYYSKTLGISGVLVSKEMRI